MSGFIILLGVLAFVFFGLIYLLGAFYVIAYTCYTEIRWWFVERPRADRIDRERNRAALMLRLNEQKAKKAKRAAALMEQAGGDRGKVRNLGKREA